MLNAQPLRSQPTRNGVRLDLEAPELLLKYSGMIRICEAEDDVESPRFRDVVASLAKAETGLSAEVVHRVIVLNGAVLGR